jgi:predicted CopG family antitoxin
MPFTILVPDDLYKRLELHAIGFDSPVNVIERLLDRCENKLEKNYPNENAPQVIKIKKPELVFHPSENEFKENLLKQKKAFVSLHKSDGTINRVEWKARRFSSTSSLRGNLWSGLLRNWEIDGIIKAELSVN